MSTFDWHVDAARDVRRWERRNVLQRLRCGDRLCGLRRQQLHALHAGVLPSALKLFNRARRACAVASVMDGALSRAAWDGADLLHELRGRILAGV